MRAGAKQFVETEAQPWVHPAILRLIALAPRIRTKAAFELTASAARVEGVTKPGYSPQKRFIADLGESPPTWASNDETFWRPVSAVLFDRRSDEQAIAHYLRPAGSSAPPEPTPLPQAEKKPASIPRRWRAPSGEVVALLVLVAGIGFAAYDTDSRPAAPPPVPPAAKAPAPEVVKAPAPAPEIAKAPEPEVVEAPEPAPAPKITRAAALPSPKAQMTKRDAPADGCYRPGDIVTALGTAARSDDAWVFTTAKPLCIHDAASPRMISRLQIVGTPPAEGVSLALSGELLAHHRIRVGGRSRP